jgi:hypothetical protein
VIAINHFNDEMFLIENKIEGLKSEILEIENIIKTKMLHSTLLKKLRKKLQI